MNNNRSIQSFVEQLIQKIDPGAQVMVFPIKESTLSIDIKVEDANILIGQNGETLFEIQYLLKSMLKRKSPDAAYVDLDINNYKKKKTEYLRELARASANDVSLSRRIKILSPMAAYERRIIHLELAAREDVVTESVGQGAGRKVIIKPRP